MNIRDLKYLTAIAKYGHFGKAAKACHISQPALSMQIKRLEDYLGVKLFERSNKTVMLTEHGRLLAEKANLILDHVEDFIQASKLDTDPLAGELKLGIIPTIAPYLLPKIFPNLKSHFPKLAIYLIEEQTHLLLDKLKNGDIDAAVLALPTDQTNLTEMHLFDDEFFLAVSNNHFLANRKSIKPIDIENMNLLLLEEGHCLSDQVLTFCDTHNIKAVQEFKATSLETLRYMVAANLGITLMPKLACRHDDGISYIHFNIKPKPKRSLGMVWRNTAIKQILFKAIIKTIQES
jgi:LysR family hydrogen peroxide-inducible transcriptional activator